MGSIPGSRRSLEEGMATHFNILAWRILLTDEPGGWAAVHRITKSPTEVTWHLRTHALITIPAQKDFLPLGVVNTKVREGGYCCVMF